MGIIGSKKAIDAGEQLTLVPSLAKKVKAFVDSASFEELEKALSSEPEEMNTFERRKRHFHGNEWFGVPFRDVGANDVARPKSEKLDEASLGSRVLRRFSHEVHELPEVRHRRFRRSPPLDDVLELCSDPEALRELHPRDAHLAIEKLAKHRGERQEQAIVDILSALELPQRGEAMRLLDAGGDKYNVDYLLSSVLNDPMLNLRAKVMFDEARAFVPTAARLIISDVDDTVKPWKDRTVDGPVFPGAVPFYRALDLGKDGCGSPGDIHFVTARDGNVLSAENDLKKTGVEVNSICYGTAFAGVLGLLGFTERMKQKKVENICKLLERNPSCQAVLLGDSTQADPQVFLEIAKQEPERLELALIHRIQGYPLSDELQRAIQENPKFIVFDTYADAAEELYARGKISEAQMQEVLRDR